MLSSYHTKKLELTRRSIHPIPPIPPFRVVITGTPTVYQYPESDSGEDDPFKTFTSTEEQPIPTSPTIAREPFRVRPSMGRPSTSSLLSSRSFLGSMIPQKRPVDIESVGSKRSKRAAGVQTRSAGVQTDAVELAWDRSIHVDEQRPVDQPIALDSPEQAPKDVDMVLAAEHIEEPVDMELTTEIVEETQQAPVEFTAETIQETQQDQNLPKTDEQLREEINNAYHDNDDVDYGDFYYEEANRAADEMGEGLAVPPTEDPIIPQDQPSAPEEEILIEDLDPEVEQRARELASAYMTPVSKHQIVKLGNIHVQALEKLTTKAVRSQRHVTMDPVTREAVETYSDGLNEIYNNYNAHYREHVQVSTSIKKLEKLAKKIKLEDGEVQRERLAIDRQAQKQNKELEALDAKIRKVQDLEDFWLQVRTLANPHPKMTTQRPSY